MKEYSVVALRESEKRSSDKFASKDFVLVYFAATLSKKIFLGEQKLSL